MVESDNKEKNMKIVLISRINFFCKSFAPPIAFSPSGNQKNFYASDAYYSHFSVNV